MQAQDLWKPQLIFENNYQREPITYIPTTSIMMIDRKGPSQPTRLSQLDEGRIYNSSMTRILMKNIHFLHFNCRFNLIYFPFDYQVCHVEASKIFAETMLIVILT